MSQIDAEKTEAGPSFWKTFPGVLTAISGIVVSFSGLLTGLSAAGLIGGKNTDGAVVATVAPSARVAGPIDAAAFVAPAPSPVRSPADGLSDFRVGEMSDGFAWVRKAPSRQGQTLRKLPSGAHVRCGNRLRDTDPSSDSRWRFCPEHDGYVSARLLISAED